MDDLSQKRTKELKDLRFKIFELMSFSTIEIETLSLITNQQLDNVFTEFLGKYAITIEDDPSFQKYLSHEPIREFLEGLKKVELPSEKSGWIDLSKRFMRVLQEVLLCRTVEAFEYYLSSMLYRALLKYPGALDSSTITLQQLRDCKNIEDALHQVIDRKVRDLSYSGLEDIIAFLNKLGLDIDPKTDKVRAVKEVLEVRHIIVHNESKIDKRFLERTKRNDLNEGNIFPMDDRYERYGQEQLLEFANKLDESFILHFGLTDS